MTKQIVRDDTVREFLNFLKTKFDSVGDLTGLKTTTKKNIVAAVNEVLTNINSASNAVGTLSSLKTGAKTNLVAAINELLTQSGALSGLSTSAKDSIVNAVNEIFGNTAHLAVNDAKTHNLRLSYNLLGTSITAAQLAAIRAGTYVGIYPGDYWILTVGGKSMKAVVLQLGGFKENSVAVWLCTGISSALNDKESTVDGYVASKMHTEILPELLTQLQAAIGAENIAAITHTLSNQVTDGKISGVVQVNSSLELLSVGHIYGAAFSDIRINAWAHNSVNPLAFFNLWRGGSWTDMYGTGEPWTCTPENATRYYIAGPHQFYAEAPTGTNREVAPFFVLA